ncbi:signal peptide containing protein [Theileria equi strain WA]|uniref:Signal peptide containing protein n=1 Tax=Theileria equi strain WA TaxID=1537102 RepID=L1LFE4_THEEQ|nr:signal peptide containing protein [Theileria equi strain WA]EKX73868.1 signal peptide containing protein [Theileria equi strain WA]|eukprot:XP_004833320.1 signal peptide containing protein [Theileria equi strain WA]
MRILAVLWTVCLVRLCYGGDNGKVDSTLFNVEEAEKNAVKVLKLTPKKGAKATKLTYEGLTVWEDKKKSCLSAVLYMDRDQPTLAVIRTKGIKSGAEFTVYKYHNGKKWKKGNESNHKKKLKELQDAARPKESTETVGDNVEEKAKPANKPGDVPARRDPVKTVQHTPQAPSTNKPDTEDSPVVQQNLYTPTQQAVKPVTASSVQVDSTPIALDLNNPDKSKLDVHTETELEVSLKGYTPKNTFHISSVLEGDKELWKSARAGHKCLIAQYCAKDDATILYLEVETSGKCSTRYSEKIGNEWTSLKENEFNEKAKTMIGESGKNVSLNITHPNRLLHKSFNYSFAGNVVQLTVPNNGVSVKKLMDAKKEVWTPGKNEEFGYAKLYTKDGKAELVSVTLKTSTTVKEHHLELKDGKWVPRTNSDAKIKSLVEPVQWVSDFNIDLSTYKDTKECTIFETELLGVTTKHFFPKPGNTAALVKDGNKELWASINPSDTCLSCLYYKGNSGLLEMIVIENSSRRYKYFEKVNGEWSEIEKTTFNSKLNEMRNGT